MRRVFERQDDDAVPAARRVSRVMTAYFPLAVDITSLITRASTTSESVIFGAAGFEMSSAYRRSPIVVR